MMAYMGFRNSSVADGTCPKRNKTLNIARLAGKVNRQARDIQRRREDFASRASVRGSRGGVVPRI
jgi:hypothetical protein